MTEAHSVNIKQRIIGALVLVSLGLIFIPLLLNGGVDKKKSLFDKPVPEIPKALTKVLPSVPKAKTMPAPKQIRAYPERMLQSSASKTKTKTGQDSKPVAHSKQRPAAAPVSDNTSYQTVQQASDAKITAAYTLQIASFSKKDNALLLQKKLRKKKFKAYIESFQAKKGRLYRLRVGPYLKFEQIKRIKRNIEKQFKLKDMVIVNYQI